MKFLSFEHKGKSSFGCLDGDGIADLGAVLSEGYRSLKAVVVGEGDGSFFKQPLSRRRARGVGDDVSCTSWVLGVASVEVVAAAQDPVAGEGHDEDDSFGFVVALLPLLSISRKGFVFFFGGSSIFPSWTLLLGGMVEFVLLDFSVKR